MKLWLIPIALLMMALVPIVSAQFFDDFNYNSTSDLYAAGWSVFNQPSMITTVSVGNSNVTVQNVCPIGYFCGFSGIQANSTLLNYNSFFAQERYMMVTHLSNQSNIRGFVLRVSTQAHWYEIVWNPGLRLTIQRDGVYIYSNASWGFIQPQTWYTTGIMKVGNNFSFYYEGINVFNYTDSYVLTDYPRAVRMAFGEYQYEIDWVRVDEIVPPTPTPVLSCRICYPLNQMSYTWRFGCLMSNFLWCNSWVIILLIVFLVGVYVYYKSHEAFQWKK